MSLFGRGAFKGVWGSVFMGLFMKRGRSVKVKAKANFTATVFDGDGVEQKDFEVHEGDVVELRGAVLQYHLDNASVTRDLTWSPEDKGGQ